MVQDIQTGYQDNFELRFESYLNFMLENDVILSFYEKENRRKSLLNKKLKSAINQNHMS
jgi:hypothetical protein